MLTSRASRIGLAAAIMAASFGYAGSASAFDPDSGVSAESGPFALFKFGFSAYKKGRKDEAVEAYKYAAEKGHRGARWALGVLLILGFSAVDMLGAFARGIGLHTTGRAHADAQALSYHRP